MLPNRLLPCPHFRIPALASALAVAALLVPASATAEPSGMPAATRAATVRAGMSSDPDQLVVGGSAMFTNDFVANLRFEPSLLVGSGDHLTSIRITGDAKYLFAIANADGLLAYPLAGISWQHFSVDCSESFPGVEVDCSGSEAGIVIGGGVEWKRIVGELHIGIGDIADLTITGGYIFPL